MIAFRVLDAAVGFSGFERSDPPPPPAPLVLPTLFDLTHSGRWDGSGLWEGPYDKDVFAHPYYASTSPMEIDEVVTWPLAGGDGYRPDQNMLDAEFKFSKAGWGKYRKPQFLGMMQALLHNLAETGMPLPNRDIAACGKPFVYQAVYTDTDPSVMRAEPLEECVDRSWHWIRHREFWGRAGTPDFNQRAFGEIVFKFGDDVNGGYGTPKSMAISWVAPYVRMFLITKVRVVETAQEFYSLVEQRTSVAFWDPASSVLAVRLFRFPIAGGGMAHYPVAVEKDQPDAAFTHSKELHSGSMVVLSKDIPEAAAFTDASFNLAATRIHRSDLADSIELAHSLFGVHSFVQVGEATRSNLVRTVEPFFLRTLADLDHSLPYHLGKVPHPTLNTIIPQFYAPAAVSAAERLDAWPPGGGLAPACTDDQDCPAYTLDVKSEFFCGLASSPFFGSSTAGTTMRGNTNDGGGIDAMEIWTMGGLAAHASAGNVYTSADELASGQGVSTTTATPVGFSIDVKMGLPTERSFSREAAGIALHEMFHYIQFSNNLLAYNKLFEGAEFESEATGVEMHPSFNALGGVLSVRAMLTTQYAAGLSDGRTFWPRYDGTRFSQGTDYSFCWIYNYFSRFDSVLPSGLRKPEFLVRFFQQQRTVNNDVHGKVGSTSFNMYNRSTWSQLYVDFPSLSPRRIFDAALAELDQPPLKHWYKSLVLSAHLLVGETKGRALGMAPELTFPDWAGDTLSALEGDTLRQRLPDPEDQATAVRTNMKMLTDLAFADAPRDTRNGRWLIDKDKLHAANLWWYSYLVLGDTPFNEKVRMGHTVRPAESVLQEVQKLPPLSSTVIRLIPNATYAVSCDKDITLVLMSYARGHPFHLINPPFSCESTKTTQMLKVPAQMAFPKLFVFNLLDDEPSSHLSPAEAEFVLTGGIG